jgi:hypothetical protein
MMQRAGVIEAVSLRVSVMLRASDMKTGPRGLQACVVAVIVGNRLAAEAQPRSC